MEKRLSEKSEDVKDGVAWGWWGEHSRQREQLVQSPWVRSVPELSAAEKQRGRGKGQQVVRSYSGRSDPRRP